MKATLSAESATWISSSRPISARSASVDLGSDRPIGVSREGYQNYLRNSGTFDPGKWAIEAKEAGIPKLESSDKKPFPGQARSAKVVGDEALKNYLRNVSTSQNLLTSDYQPPNPHHKIRIKPEAQKNYMKDRQSRVKDLLQNYGKFPSSYSTPSDEVDQKTSNSYQQRRKDAVGPLLANYSHFPPSPRPVPHVHGDSAMQNLQKSRSTSNIIAHSNDFRPPTADPHIKGEQAQKTYEIAQGRAMSALLQNYGKFPQSPRRMTKVNYGGVANLEKGRGDAMRKTLMQCPLSHRHRERLLPA